MTEFVDVVIVGAGISGISAAWHLQDRCPSKSYVILERRENLGGTWDLFRYPGIRSDSDMFTLGFRFKPWTSREGHRRRPVDPGLPQGSRRRVRHRQAHPVRPQGRRRRLVRRGQPLDGPRRPRTAKKSRSPASFLFACSGYYNYDEGYSPEFAGSEDFERHHRPPAALAGGSRLPGKKIVVIGSGATAVTLIPALADSGAGHVTMLQRSPTYIGSLPDVDPFAVRTEQDAAGTRPPTSLNRWKSIVVPVGAVPDQPGASRNFMRKTLMTMAKRRLPEGYDVEKHFGPSYKPWDQRLCLAPNGDLFRAIREARPTSSPTPSSGSPRPGSSWPPARSSTADIIVTATGLNLQLFGGAAIMRNGVPVDLTTHGLQGHDAHRTCRTWRSPSATPTRRGR